MDERNLIEKFRDSQIIKFSFSSEGVKNLKENTVFGENWPVVYLLSNQNTAYVGESSNACQRMRDHLGNEERKDLKDMRIVYNPRFNKSVILDLESTLIAMMKADHRFHLQNNNSGQKMEHNYYQQDLYRRATFPHVWDLLKQEKLVSNSYDEIRNSDLFKFSPYHSLSEEQYEVATDIIKSLTENVAREEKKAVSANTRLASFPEGKTYFVKGAPGTGKSVLAVYLIKKLTDIFQKKSDTTDLESVDPFYKTLQQIRQSQFKIGFVIPQTPLRNTLKKVFKETDGLDSKMILGPNDVSKEYYDLLIVDESHRLNRRNQLTGYKAYDDVNRRLHMSPESTQLDWILAQSTYQILIYDPEQTVRASDVLGSDFKKLMNSSRAEVFTLDSQLRVAGGNDYIRYVDQLFSDHPPYRKLDFLPNYQFRLYDQVKDMVDEIQKLQNEYGLCRILAGYSWKWATKGKTLYDVDKKDRPFDFEIQGVRFVWNSQLSDWINSKHAMEEVGCIHTVQGYDLNFSGVIIGPDLTYDKEKKKIIFHPEYYFDVKNKSLRYEEKKKAAINAYKVMLTRAIHGTFVYVCDKNLREYWSNFIDLC